MEAGYTIEINEGFYSDRYPIIAQFNFNNTNKVRIHSTWEAFAMSCSATVAIWRIRPKN